MIRFKLFNFIEKSTLFKKNITKYFFKKIDVRGKRGMEGGDEAKRRDETNGRSNAEPHAVSG